MKRITIRTLLLLVFCLFQRPLLAEELIQVPAAIQISSSASDGKYSIAEIVDIARENNIKVVILADRDWMKWEYGLWPLRNIVKKTVEGNSIFKYGIGRYLQMLSGIQKANPDILLIPGVESAPFYYWRGNPLGRDFTIVNWHKHIMVIGLDKPAQLRYLPVVGNTAGLRLPFKIKNVLNFWPLLPLVMGIYYFRKPQFDYKDSSGRQLSRPSKGSRVTGILLIICGGIFLLNNYPFCDLKFDQYHQDLGIMPYQNFIDYVDKKGGVTFWAHPEAEYITEEKGIGIETRPHVDYLLKTSGYAGFAMFYKSYHQVASPGGAWDKVLNEYCQGRRSASVWAIGGLGFDTAGNLNKYLQDLKTVFLVSEINTKEVLSSLKSGRMYIVRGKDSPAFTLDEFKVSDSIGGAEAIMGEEIKLSGKPLIKIKGHFLDGKSVSLKIKLIRNGEIIAHLDVATPFDITYQDDSLLQSGRAYYRAEITSEGMLAVVNPVFVTKK